MNFTQLTQKLNVSRTDLSALSEKATSLMHQFEDRKSNALEPHPPTTSAKVAQRMPQQWTLPLNSPCDENIDIQELVEYGKRSTYKGKIKNEIDALIARRVDFLAKKALNPNMVSSVRLDLCELSRIDHVHYQKRKAEILDLLKCLLDRDPIIPGTANDVLRIAQMLCEDFNTDSTLKVKVIDMPIQFQKNITRAFTAAIELYLQHYKKVTHVNALPDPDVFRKTIAALNSINKQGNVDIQVVGEIALLAIEKLPSKHSKTHDMFNRLGHLADALKAAYDKDIKQFFSKLKKTFEGLKDKIPKEWFEMLCTMRNSVYNTQNDLERIMLIKALLSKDPHKLDWKFLYAALDTLESIALVKGQSSECVDEVCETIKSFETFDGYETSAYLFKSGKKSDDEKIKKKAKQINNEISKMRKEADALPPIPPRPVLPPNLNEIRLFHNAENSVLDENSIKELLKINGEALQNLRNNDGNTLLIVAAIAGRTNNCELLLKMGAVPTTRGNEDRHVLHVAAIKSRTGVIAIFYTHPLWEKLLEGVDAYGRTPLMYAAEAGNLSSFEMMLKASNQTAVDHQQRTILHMASASDRHQIVKESMKCVDVLAKDIEGSTALHLGAREGHYQTCIELLSNQNRKQALMDTVDKLGTTPLMQAATLGGPARAAICELLLREGSDPRCTDGLGWTALHFSVAAGEVDTTEVLLRSRYCAELINDFVIISKDSALCRAFAKSTFKKRLMIGYQKIEATGFDFFADIIIGVFFLKYVDLSKNLSFDQPYIGEHSTKKFSVKNPLAMALHCRKPLQMTQLLLHYTANPLLKDHFYRNLLERAVLASQVEVTDHLLQSDFKTRLLQSASLKEGPLFHSGVKSNRPLEMCQVLLRSGLKPNVWQGYSYKKIKTRQHDGSENYAIERKNPLHIAIELGKLSVVKLLVTERGLLANTELIIIGAAYTPPDRWRLVTESYPFRNLICLAVDSSQVEIVHYFLESDNLKKLVLKTDKRRHLKRWEEHNPLFHRAVITKRAVEMCQVLLNAGFNPCEIHDYPYVGYYERRNALHVAILAGEVEAVQLLLRSQFRMELLVPTSLVVGKRIIPNSSPKTLAERCKNSAEMLKVLSEYS